MNKEGLYVAKLDILMAKSVEEVSSAIEMYLKRKVPFEEITFRDKVVFLATLFDEKIYGLRSEDSDELKFELLASTIINFHHG